MNNISLPQDVVDSMNHLDKTIDELCNKDNKVYKIIKSAEYTTKYEEELFDESEERKD